MRGEPEDYRGKRREGEKGTRDSKCVRNRERKNEIKNINWSKSLNHSQQSKMAHYCSDNRLSNPYSNTLSNTHTHTHTHTHTIHLINSISYTHAQTQQSLNTRVPDGRILFG